MRRGIRSGFACAAVAAAALIAGCGGGGKSSSQQGVATITPASAPFYVDANLKPQGDQKNNINSFLSAVLATNDPGTAITNFINKSAQKSGKNLNYTTDIKPWLGDSAGAFATGFQSQGPSLVALKATDTAKGIAFFRSQAQSATPQSYKGVNYFIDEKGKAFGAIGDFVAIGDDTAFKAAVDAEQGQSLAEADQFKTATKDVPSDSLGVLYLNVKNVVNSSFSRSVSSSNLPPSVANNIISKIHFPDTVVLSASAEPKAVSLNVNGVNSFGGSAPALLGKLPADATFAFGVSDAGGKLKGLVKTIESLGIPGVVSGFVDSYLQGKYGISLQGDVFPWMGDAAIFLRGTSPSNQDGALVIQSKDDAAAAATMNKLRSAAQSLGIGTPQPLKFRTGGTGFTISDPSFSQPLNFVQDNGLFVIGVGVSATQDALTPSAPLSSTSAFKAASSALSGGPSFFISVPGLLPLISATQNAKAAANYAQAKPYLDRLSYLVGGGAGNALKIVLGAK